MAIVSEVVVGLSGTLEEERPRELPNSDLQNQRPS